MGDMFISSIKDLTVGLRCQDVTAFLRTEPCAVTLARWYIGSCLSAVCLCQCMQDSCRVESVDICHHLGLPLRACCWKDTTSLSLPTRQAEDAAEPPDMQCYFQKLPWCHQHSRLNTFLCHCGDCQSQKMQRSLKGAIRHPSRNTDRNKQWRRQCRRKHVARNTTAVSVHLIDNHNQSPNVQML